ncbi:hypothetical protein MKO06_06730 [Gramella sp. GC03-9]|uniref:Uncharacterized protein n=1 Tax=Christiangramia oceanisediminis TaxID=2920386 RepID=A0A9X2I1N0_9FLAO|nr:hypothetical protein [Gramella oceanisediminis]MCP9199594.1 hypothetical protein [Gramella oceanisediminis]
MSLAHILKLAGKFAIRGFIFKAGKKAAVRGGNVGIAAGALIAGGYLAYELLQDKKRREKNHEELAEADDIDGSDEALLSVEE